MDRSNDMKNPVHPGEVIREAFLIPLELSVTQAAQDLKVDRSTLSRLVNRKISVSPQMAIKLAKTFGGDPETWLNMQAMYDRAELPQLWETVEVTKSYRSDGVPTELVAA